MPGYHSEVKVTLIFVERMKQKECRSENDKSLQVDVIWNEVNGSDYDSDEMIGWN